MKTEIGACGAALIALAGAWQPAYAQDGDNDIIVTARRVEERLQDVPISITAFSQQQLANRNIVSAGDIAQYTPSLTSNSRYGPEKTSFSIRGFNQDNGTAPSVGVYFADVPALRSIGGTTTGNGAGPGSFFDLANVQVLKGPQGTLFGRNTSGGAVLLVPQKPTGKFEGYVEGSVGNYDLRRVQAVVNIPVMDTLRVRLGVDRQTRDGFMKNRSGLGPTNFNDIDYWAGRLSIVADLTPNLENYFIATYSKSHTNSALPTIFECDRRTANSSNSAANELTKLACAQVDRSRASDFYSGENGLTNPYQKIEQWQVINNTTWRASDNLTIKNIVSYGEFREALRGTVYGENLVVTSGPNAGQAATSSFSNPRPGSNNAALSTFTEEFQLQGTAFGDRLTWQAGAYFESASPLGFSGALSAAQGAVCLNDDVLQCSAFRPSAAATGTTAPTVSSSANKYFFQDYGLYSQGTFKLNSHFSVTAGVRYTWDYYQAASRYVLYTGTPTAASPTGFLPTGTCRNTLAFGAVDSSGNTAPRAEEQCETYVRGHSSAPTWLIDLDYKPTDDILVYAKYARGYRQGQLKTDGYGKEAFDPERIEAYEVGLKTSWHGAVRGTFNVAAFYNDLSNQQISAAATFRAAGLVPASIIVNAGKSEIKGVEVDGSLSPFQGFTVDFGYAYLDTKIKSIAMIAPDATYSLYTPNGANLGLPLTYTPKNKYTITGTYVLPLPSSAGKVSIGATFTHTDSYQATYQTNGCILADPNSATGKGTGACAARTALGYDIGKVAGFDLLNLNLNWNSVAGGPIDLAVFATNVTNQKYYTATFGGYTNFGFEGASVGEPRMYGVRLKYRFGS
ncbi:MAG: TonB-dependent receptor [Sphingobium sp.]